MTTSKERMLVALQRGKPDRMPVTIHQWQAFHLRQFMNGMDQIQAFREIGLDASVTPLDVWQHAKSSNWQSCVEKLGGEGQPSRYRVTTPDGELTRATASNEYTSFTTEHIIKTQQDAEIFLKYWPEIHLDQTCLTQWYDRTGDDGIVRGFVGMYAQPGVWQEFCEMVGTQEAIFWAMDHPGFVHHFLEEMTLRKIDFIQRELPGAKYDLIEHGGGSASSTVISPTMFDEFCLPYDRRVIDALHEIGLPVVYHTCGGMMAILDHLPDNGCDACETLSPPGMGGDIHLKDQITVKQKLGSKVALIGGIDQSNTLTHGTPEQVAAEVHACFETFGKDGGYICSASDHFFHAPVANLKSLANAGRECHY